MSQTAGFRHSASKEDIQEACRNTTGMALLRYLQVLPRGQLPDPMGALTSSLPSLAIAEANAAVTKLPMLGTKKRLQRRREGLI